MNINVNDRATTRNKRGLRRGLLIHTLCNRLPGDLKLNTSFLFELVV